MNLSERKLRILLLGRHELGCRVLEAICLQSSIELAVVPARHEDAGRRPALAHAANQSKIKLFARSKNVLSDAIGGFQPDLLVSAGYDRIISCEALARVSRCVNVHFSLLPKYRGSYSIPWAILNNEAELGVTLHEITPGIDDGPIIRQARFANDPRESCRDSYDRAVGIGSDLIVWLIERTLAGKSSAATAQDERLATYYAPQYPGDFKVPWRQTATYIINYIRAAHFPPYDGAFGKIGDRHMVFNWPVEMRFERPGAAPGAIVQSGTKLGIAAFNGLIFPDAVSVDGSPMRFEDAVSRYSLRNHVFA